MVPSEIKTKLARNKLPLSTLKEGLQGLHKVFNTRGVINLGVKYSLEIQNVKPQKVGVPWHPGHPCLRGPWFENSNQRPSETSILSPKKESFVRL